MRDDSGWRMCEHIDGPPQRSNLLFKCLPQGDNTHVQKSQPGRLASASVSETRRRLVNLQRPSRAGTIHGNSAVLPHGRNCPQRVEPGRNRGVLTHTHGREITRGIHQLFQWILPLRPFSSVFARRDEEGNDRKQVDMNNRKDPLPNPTPIVYRTYVLQA